MNHDWKDKRSQPTLRSCCHLLSTFVNGELMAIYYVLRYAYILLIIPRSKSLWICCSAFVSRSIRLSISAAWNKQSREETNWEHNLHDINWYYSKLLEVKISIRLKLLNIRSRWEITCLFSSESTSFNGCCLLQNEPMLSTTK